MAKLIVLITPQLEQGHEIGEAWEAAGVSGVTYIESHGLHGLRQAGHTMAVLPGMSSVLEILRSSDLHNVTLFTVVQDEGLVDKVIAATVKLVGDLERPDNGILFVVDVERVIGVRRLEKHE
jgi:nitrogen regulatory protein PII